MPGRYVTVERSGSHTLKVLVWLDGLMVSRNPSRRRAARDPDANILWSVAIVRRLLASYFEKHPGCERYRTSAE